MRLGQSVEIKRQQIIDKLLAAGVTETAQGRQIREMSLTELIWELNRRGLRV